MDKQERSEYFRLLASLRRRRSGGRKGGRPRRIQHQPGPLGGCRCADCRKKTKTAPAAKVVLVTKQGIAVADDAIDARLVTGFDWGA